MTNRRSITFITVLLAGLLAVGMLAAPAAATGHVDTLAGDGTDTINNFNASEDRYVEYSLASDGTDFAADGTTTVFMNMTVDDEHVEVSNGTFNTSTASYTFNVSQDEMGTIPGDANSTTNITVNAWGEDDGGNVTTTVDTFNADIVFTDGYAVVYVGDSAAAGNVNGVDVQSTQASGILASLNVKEDTYTVDANSVGLGQNASGTTVHIVAANQSNVSAFSAAEDKRFGSYESGDYFGNHLLTISDHTHAVFYQEAPTEDLAGGYTYATVSERNGHDTYSVHVDDDYSGESSLDISATANDGPTFDFWVKKDAYDSTLGAVGMMAVLFGSIARREV